MKSINFSKPGISFVTGVPISLDIGLLILSIDELFQKKEPFSLLVVKKQNVDSAIMVPHNCVDVIVVQNEDDIIGYFLSEEGLMWCYNGSTIESVDPIPLTQEILLRSQTYTKKDEHFVVGGFNEFFFKDIKSQWKIFKINTFSEIKEYGYVGFEKVLSDCNNRLVYLFGFHGIGYILSDNNEPQPINLPKKEDIYDAVILNEKIYTCGNEGTIMFGSGANQWVIIKNEITKDKLWGISVFRERIFVCSMTKIYEIIDGKLQQFKYLDSDKIPSSTYKLKSCNDGIWAIWAKQLMKFNGKGWSEILLLG